MNQKMKLFIAFVLFIGCAHKQNTESETKRVFGGENRKYFQFNEGISSDLSEAIGYLSTRCTGTIVMGMYVLTAASCVLDENGNSRLGNNLTFKVNYQMINRSPDEIEYFKDAFWIVDSSAPQYFGTRNYKQEPGKNWALIKFKLIKKSNETEEELRIRTRNHIYGAITIPVVNPGNSTYHLVDPESKIRFFGYVFSFPEHINQFVMTVQGRCPNVRWNDAYQAIEHDCDTDDEEAIGGPVMVTRSNRERVEFINVGFIGGTSKQLFIPMNSEIVSIINHKIPNIE